MKKFLLLFFIVVTSFTLFAQTATSISNGNWISPGTWQGGVVPTPGYNVIINHNVTLGMNWGFSSGSITINQNGSLTQSSTNFGILISGTGSITNHGTLNFTKLALSNCNACSNSGTFQNMDSLYVDANFTNSGTLNASNILIKESITNTGNILATNILVDGTFDNQNTISTTNFFNNNNSTNSLNIHFVDLTNAGIFLNTGTLTADGNITNKGIFTNQNSGVINIQIDFSNVDSLSHDAKLTNNGKVNVIRNFANIDTIIGTGQFCIGESTFNSGVLLGTFDFCDQTSSNGGSFDLNNGSIAPSITFCTLTCNLNAPNQLLDNNTSNIYPNPASSILQFSNLLPNSSFDLYDVTGKLILENKIDNTTIIDVSSLDSGIYFYKINDGIGIKSGKILKL